jgi:hypothetical protein
MAIPNLYLTIRKVSPLHWYECYKQRDLHSIQKLYFSTVPIPGIYAITANRRHYLIAIKPIKGKSNAENIFKPAKKSCHDPTIRSNADKANQIISNNLSRKLSFSSTRTTLNGDIDDKKDCFFGYRFTHPEYVKVLEQDKPTHSKKYVPFGTGGHGPHQKSPFRNYLSKKQDNRLSQLLDFLGYRGESRLQEADMNGFRKLRNPLRIKFCSLTRRWMFSSEIKIRTEEVLMCEDITCMRRSHEGCEKEIWRKMFALDDGYSWVEVGRLGRRKGNGLFGVDDETGCMRQSKEEVRVSEWYLEREKERFLEDDKEADYMSLVRYCQKEKCDVKNGGVYLERKRAELAKLEFGKLEEERLEEEWAEKMALQEEKLVMRFVRVWNVEFREAQAAEMELEKLSRLKAWHEKEHEE